MKDQIQTICKLIIAKRPSFQPKIAIVLGSGCANFANKLQDIVSIPYHTLPNFPISRVTGHPGQLLLGYLNKVPVICCQGRVHAYEGMQAKDFQIFIRVLKFLGCENVFMTNASGSLRKDFQAGQLVLIADHINFNPLNPLVGINDEEFGPRFFSMDNAYDRKLRHSLQQTAKKMKISLPEGVYLSVLGPNFETPAEIRAFRLLGADIIGMSTTPEVLIARHSGLKVAAISVVTNLAAGLSQTSITHEGTLHYAEKASNNLGLLLEQAIVEL